MTGRNALVGASLRRSAPACVTGDRRSAMLVLDWAPSQAALETIIEDAWR